MTKRRDIILAKVFFSDAPDAKIRPCVVLSQENYESGFILVSPITSSRDEHCIKISKPDSTCELAGGSSARADVILRISSENKMRRIGQVTSAFYNRLVEHLLKLIQD